MGYCIDHLPSRISIGRETETGVTDIRIDCTDWLEKWPGMAISALYRPPEGEPYIVLSEMVGNSLVWHVSDADTAAPGTGRLEMTGIAEGKRKLSALVDVQVARRLDGAAGPMPEAAKPWADEVMAAAATVEQAAQEAKDAAVSAGEHAASAGEAAATAETAATAAGESAATAATSATTAQTAAESAQEAEAKAQSAADRAEAAAGSGSGGGGSGGGNDVYTIKQIIEITEVGEKVTTEGTLQEAIAAYKQGKTLRMATVLRFDGNEIVTDETIHCHVDPYDSYVIFYLLHSNGKGVDILRKKFTADGFADELGKGETVLNSLYVTGGVQFFLHSSTRGSKKFFRIKVDDSGSLSTEDVGEIK